MEKINTEKIISTLLVYGFDKVDSLLYTLVLGKLTLDNYNSNGRLFEFEDKKTSVFFDIYVKNDGFTYSLIDGYDLDTRVETHIEGYYTTLKKALHPSQTLLEYFDKIDFKEIIIKKIASIGADKIEEFNFLFSNLFNFSSSPFSTN